MCVSICTLTLTALIPETFFLQRNFIETLGNQKTPTPSPLPSSPQCHKIKCYESICMGYNFRVI